MKQHSFFDIHSHIHDKAFDEDREKLLDEMKSYGLRTITVGTDIHESKKALELAEKYEHVYATVGLHPADSPMEKFDVKKYTELAKHKKVVAIGECGIDYFRLKDGVENLPAQAGEKKRQKEILKEQIKLAINLDKPLMLHGRPSKGSMDAYEDMLDILELEHKKHGNRLRGNAHFFVGNIEIAKRFIDIGFTMSFSGVITFTHDYDDVVRFIPLNMMHAETDSPYATPVPFRGQRNTPMYVQETVARIAVLREQHIEEVRAQLLENAKRVFGI